MKFNYIKIFSIVGVIFISLNSCKTQLEPAIEYAIDANRLKTIVDFERVLNGAYETMKGVSTPTAPLEYRNNNTGYYRFGYHAGADIGTDNMIETSASLGNNRSLAQWYFNANTPAVERAWIAPYQVINHANVVLENIGNLVETAPGQRDIIKGQALALRALAHFDLMRYFAPSYDRNSSDLGVVIKTKSEANFPPRSTVKECYDFVYKDLTDAEELLKGIEISKINPGTRKSKIDIHGVRAIRARVSLYAKDWADAKDYADKVITQSNISLGSVDSTSIGVNVTPSAIQNPKSYQSVWFNDLNTSTEVIFALPYIQGQGNPGVFPNDGVNGYTVSSDWRSLFGTIPTNDVRYNVSYNPSASPAANSYLKFSGRFNGTGIARDGITDVKVLRMSEMHLIRAEANFNLGNEADARTDIRLLRTNRIKSYKPLLDNVADILENIKLERRKELVGEGHRWFDARRYNLGFDRGAAPGQGDCPSTAPNCSIQAGDYRFVYPIPLGEIKANSAMSGQQNPGW
ncbi:MAG: RagB/SusD family nutrient uptake outer membrane protein [Raineya sp.]|jgi:hypothetical protein|nr:RagB/SusD family nutrient uptake outer membrane protein [Raineya sp.]